MSDVGQRIRVNTDGRGDAGGAKTNALRQVRDSKSVGTMLKENGTDFGGAVTVGLDDRKNLSVWANKLADRSDVRGGGVQIDLEDGGSTPAYDEVFADMEGATAVKRFEDTFKRSSLLKGAPWQL